MSQELLGVIKEIVRVLKLKVSRITVVKLRVSLITVVLVASQVLRVRVKNVWEWELVGTFGKFIFPPVF